MINKKTFITSLFIIVVAVANAQAALYTKAKTNFVGVTQQETGIAFNKFWKSGDFNLSANFGRVDAYPLTDWSTRKPSYTSGLTLKYRLEKDGDLSLYTKAKYNFINAWQQESGVAATLWKKDNLSIGTNLGYVTPYPYQDNKNSYTGGLTFSIAL